MLWIWSAVLLPAQLVPPGQPLPHTGIPPVVFLNGYQNDCSSSSFTGTFGIADQVLAANGRASVFFDNCTLSGKPSIEKLGAAFGAFLSALAYADGSPVNVVDVVAHSMGGLIVRSYLAGKQEQEGVFAPPASTHIRKLIFLATPHFGTSVAFLGFGLNSQLDELSSGSHFIFDLATWNDGADDLRAIDAIAVVGNAGTGLAVAPGFDDGEVALTSASLDFYQPGRTRVIPYCHNDPASLLFAGLCNPNAKGIAKIQSDDDAPARIMVSFLNSTADWQFVGQSPQQNNFLSQGAGFLLRPHTAADASLALISATITAPNHISKKLNMSNAEIGYTDFFPAGPVQIAATVPLGGLQGAVTLSPGSELAVILKSGPRVARVYPAAAAVLPLSVAPRMIVSIYGDALAKSKAQATSLPLPVTLSDAQVTLSGSALGLLYVSPQQINAVLPDSAGGFSTLTVTNSTGSSSVNLIVESAHPAIFTANATGSGAAAAFDFNTGMPPSAASPLRAGDFLELFVTGLGATTLQDGLQVANQAPTVSISGVNCPVTFAGAAPGFAGLDQINCQVPSGLALNPAAPLIVSSGGRASNVATLSVQ